MHTVVRGRGADGGPLQELCRRSGPRAAWLLGVIGAAIACLSAACVGVSVLERPGIIGASVSAGVGSVLVRLPSDTAHPHGESGTVDLAVALDAVLATAEVRPERIDTWADGVAFLAPVESLERQVDAARAAKASVICAVDALFWCVYGPAADPGERLHRLDAGLAALGQIEAPVAVGDLPDLDDAVSRALGPLALPTPDLREEANRRIAEWVAARPNRALVPLSILVEGQANGRRTDVETGGELFAADGLHASPRGQVALAIESLNALRGARLLPADTVPGPVASAVTLLRPKPLAAALPASMGLEPVAQLIVLDADLERAIASADAQAARIAVNALFAPALAEARAFLRWPLLQQTAARDTALAEALAAWLQEHAVDALASDASPGALAGVVEVALLVGDLATAEAAARRLGVMAEAERLSRCLYAATRRTRPTVAAALLSDASDDLIRRLGGDP